MIIQDSHIDPERPDLGGNIAHGDTGTWCPALWGYLVERYAVRSVLDVGCGEGHAVAWFHRRGCVAHGFDGLRENVQQAVHPIQCFDLLSPVPFVMPVDLVWSAEVAEHIDPGQVDRYLDALCNGRVVAMTAAPPGQTGWHHVNCQPEEYWVERMAARGYDRARVPDIQEGWPTYWQKNGMVFTRGDVADVLAKVREKKGVKV